jgi:DHA1 family tetracycline resistance protein-like MFS transporter
MKNERNREAGTLVFIIVMVVLDVMAGTMAFPVLPKLIATVSPGDAARTAELFGLLGTLFAVMQFGASPVQGALSDRFGRRPVILASCFGLAIDFVIMALAPNLAWLFIGRIVSGIFAGGMTAANAYLVDVTPQERRSQMFGYLFAAMGFGVAIGPAFGGWLATIGLRTPFWVAAGLCLANALYGLFFLPESLAPDKRANIAIGSLNPFGALAGLWLAYPPLVSWAFVTLAAALGGTGLNVMFVIYTSYRYGWAPQDVGMLLTFYGAGAIGVQMGLLPLLLKRLSERAVMLLGYGVQTAAVMGAGLAPSGKLFCVSIAMLCAGIVAGPTQSAIVSRLVGGSDQGKLAGATRSLYNIPAIIAPSFFSFVFAEAIMRGGKPFSGVPFLFAGAMMAFAAVMAARNTSGAQVTS